MYKYIDIGLNLFSEQFAGREDETVRRAAEKEVGIIITGSSERSSRRASEYVQGREGIYATAGVHPHDAKSWNDTTAGKLRKMLKSSANMPQLTVLSRKTVISSPLAVPLPFTSTKSCMI